CRSRAQRARLLGAAPRGREDRGLMATRPLPKKSQPEPVRLRVVGGSAAGRRLSVGAVMLLVLTVFCVAALQAYAAQVGFRVASLERQVRVQEEQTTLLQARQAQLAT